MSLIDFDKDVLLQEIQQIQNTLGVNQSQQPGSGIETTGLNTNKYDEQDLDEAGAYSDYEVEPVKSPENQKGMLLFLS